MYYLCVWSFLCISMIFYIQNDINCHLASESIHSVSDSSLVETNDSATHYWWHCHGNTSIFDLESVTVTQNYSHQVRTKTVHCICALLKTKGRVSPTTHGPSPSCKKYWWSLKVAVEISCSLSPLNCPLHPLLQSSYWFLKYLHEYGMNIVQISAEPIKLRSGQFTMIQVTGYRFGMNFILWLRLKNAYISVCITMGATMLVRPIVFCHLPFHFPFPFLVLFKTCHEVSYHL